MEHFQRASQFFESSLSTSWWFKNMYTISATYNFQHSNNLSIPRSLKGYFQWQWQFVALCTLSVSQFPCSYPGKEYHSSPYPLMHTYAISTQHTSGCQSTKGIQCNMFGVISHHQFLPQCDRRPVMGLPIIWHTLNSNQHILVLNIHTPGKIWTFLSIQPGSHEASKWSYMIPSTWHIQ